MRRLQQHNRLNGFIFVVAEFTFIGALAAIFAALYGAEQQWIGFTATCGIAANSLVVIASAVQQMLRREADLGIWRVYTDSKVRDQVARENPNLSRDTLMITGAVLVPFLLVALALAEAARRPPPH